MLWVVSVHALEHREVPLLCRKALRFLRENGGLKLKMVSSQDRLLSAHKRYPNQRFSSLAALVYANNVKKLVSQRTRKVFLLVKLNHLVR